MNSLISFLFPEPCVACGATEGEPSPLLLCGDCQLELMPHRRHLPESPLLREGWFVLDYHGPGGALIRRGKFQRDLPSLRRLSVLLAAYTPLDLEVDAVCPVPTAGRRLFYRGFDPARVLAGPVAKKLGVPHLQLLRRRDPGIQSRRSLDLRKQNLSHRFSLKACPPPRVLLVDDIHTTGATLDACAMTLLEGGTEQVSVLTLAA
jgi:ComF family protein